MIRTVIRSKLKCIKTQPSWNVARPMSAMQDEYSAFDDSGHVYTLPNEFMLESGEILNNAQVHYNSYGQLSPKRDNVIFVCHALTGNSQLDKWWNDILGPGKALDTTKYFIVSANVLGSCYGSTGPLSICSMRNRPYLSSFPKTSIRDTVRLHMKLLRNRLGIDCVKCVIGGSMGGMQALEWAIIAETDKKTLDVQVESIVSMACGASHSAWQIAFSETQRQAIKADPKWNGGHYDIHDPPKSGLHVARQIAMLSYRSPVAYDLKFARTLQDDEFSVKRYLVYQGDKFVERFDANSYIILTEQMDSHDVGRGRGGIQSALSLIRCPTLILGINSDVLYPLSQQMELNELISHSQLRVIDSIHGHDAFLLEHEQVGDAVMKFLH